MFNFRLVVGALALFTAANGKPSHFSRDHQNIKRATTDQCVYLNHQDLVPLINRGEGTSIPDIFGSYTGCLCASNAAVFMNTYVPLQLATSLKGSAVTLNWLTGYIQSNAGTQTCAYPTGSTASCSSSSVCDFTCSNGLTKVGSACQCVAPNTICNGVCTSNACPTGGLRRRDEQDRLLRTSALCPAGTERCGVPRGTSTAYECLDTQNDLESCGGCAMPLFGEEASGRDCSAIPGVASVKCMVGKCSVGSCREGWKVANDGQSCEQIV